jgi:acetylornithine aminotransferase/acetylornithine/N-succinyldiaminopimelate aminotransferase
MMAQRIIINRTSETVLRFLPPFVLEREHVDTAIVALDGILTELARSSVAMAGEVPAGEHADGQ